MKTAAARFSALSAARTMALANAREASRLTFPGMIPEDGQNEHFQPEQPYHSVGVHGARTLVANLLAALFPTNVEFFRLEVDAGAAQQLGAPKDELDAQLAQFSQSANSLMDDLSVRPQMAEILRQLVVAGNGLLWTPLNETPRVYRIDQYVVKRDQTGAFRSIIVREKVYPSTLSEDVRMFLGLKVDADKVEEQVDCYTVVEREDKIVRHWQEINGKRVPDSEGQSPADKTGWLPLRWRVVPGSDYGIGHVTDYVGDLKTLNDYSGSIVNFATAASRFVYLIEPNSQIDPDRFAEALSGDVFVGRDTEISTKGLDKSQDFNVVRSAAADVIERISQAFLIKQFRQAERVTAEEVRAMSEELENTLGGTYSVLANELQLPIANRYLYVAERRKLVPALPKEIRPKVITGLAALGRAAEVNRLRQFIGDAASMLQSPVVMQEFNVTALLMRLGVQHGVSDLKGLLKSPEQKQQEQQQAMMQQVAGQMAPGIGQAAVAAATTPE